MQGRPQEDHPAATVQDLMVLCLGHQKMGRYRVPILKLTRQFARQLATFCNDVSFPIDNGSQQLRGIRHHNRLGP